MMKYLVVCFFLLAIEFVSFGQCDNTLKPSENAKIAYKTRGNRCEGAYVAKVGAPSLDIVGFTVGKFSYQLEKAEVIKIENATGANFSIRASAIPLNTYYRMDAQLEKNKTLNWEVKDVLFALHIPANALGVFGWLGTPKEKVFLPIKPVTSVYNKSDKKFYLVIRPSSKVLGVKYRYAALGNNFSKYESMPGSRRSGQPIVIVLPESLKGKYKMEVAALLESKSSWVKNQYQLLIK